MGYFCAVFVYIAFGVVDFRYTFALPKVDYGYDKEEGQLR